MKLPAVFVDASGWVALFSPADTLHGEATQEWQVLTAERRKFITSDYVLDESYTLLRREPYGLTLAKGLQQLVTTSQLTTVIYADTYLHQDAWHLFTLFDDQPVSYTDCMSFAIMRNEGLVEAFTFDRDFARAGLLMRPRKQRRR